MSLRRPVNFQHFVILMACAIADGAMMNVRARGPREGSLDSDFRIDVSEVNKNIDVAEVIALYFPLLRKTLLIDFRSNDVDGPMIRVVPMANTPEERIQSLKKMRPRFGRPDTITIIPWPKYIATLAELGIWERIVQRLVDAGPPTIGKDCRRCYDELQKLERQEVHRAITGENYETIWGEPGIAERVGAGDDDDDDYEDEDEDDDVFDEDE